MKFLYFRTRFVFGLTAGGSVTHTSGVVNALAEKGNIRVYSNDDLPGVKPDYEIHRPRSPKFLPVAFREFLYSLSVIFKVKVDQGTNAIYQRLSGYSFCGAYLAKKSKVPFILEYNSSTAWGLRNWSKQNSWRSLSGFFLNLYKYLFEIPVADRLENYNIQNAAVIVVVSEELKRQLVERGVDPGKIAFYPNGVDPEVYKPGIDGSAIRQKLGISKDEVVYGFIGSFGQWHGVDVLADSIARYFKRPDASKNCRFLLIGDGYTMPQVKEHLKDLDDPEKVILTGMIPQYEAVNYLSACNFLLSPHKPNPDGTKFFGSPTKLFEYMALGKGIIASELEQIGHILKHGETAFMVEPGDPESLADAFQWALSHPVEMDEFGVKAREKVLADYTWTSHVHEILSTLSAQNIV